MSDIKAGVVIMALTDLAVLLRESIGGIALLGPTEHVKSVQVNRRRNPPMLQFTVDTGRRVEAHFTQLARWLRLPPMHDVLDLWIDPRTKAGMIFLKVTGNQLPLVPHNADVPDVTLVVEVKDAAPGQPAYTKSRFDRAA